MEKPFGTDLDSARKLNAELHEVFREEQIFRIDHFLGKEAAQNILAFRFANGLFEPIWHRNHIDHVQIDIPEELGLEQRANFYESTGAYRDMVVTHLFQVLAFTAMEPPTALEPAAIGEEKNKVFRSMLPDRAARRRPRAVRRLPRHRGRRPRLRDRDLRRAQVLRRQLALGRRAVLPAHRQAPGRGRPDHLDRVPRATASRCSRPGSGVGDHGPDHLTFDLADEAKMSLSFYGKRPGPGMKLDKLSMQFAMQDTGWAGAVLEAYERLIYDAARGDRTLFTTARGHRAAVGDLHAAAGEPARRPPLRAGLVGPQPDPPAGRAVHLAAAVRAAVAQAERRGRLTDSAVRAQAVQLGGELGRLSPCVVAGDREVVGVERAVDRDRGQDRSVVLNASCSPVIDASCDESFWRDGRVELDLDVPDVPCARSAGASRRRRRRCTIGFCRRYTVFPASHSISIAGHDLRLHRAGLARHLVDQCLGQLGSERHARGRSGRRRCAPRSPRRRRGWSSRRSEPEPGAGAVAAGGDQARDQRERRQGSQETHGPHLTGWPQRRAASGGSRRGISCRIVLSALS